MPSPNRDHTEPVPSMRLSEQALSAQNHDPSAVAPSQFLAKLSPLNHSTETYEALRANLEATALARKGPLRVGILEGAFDPPHRGHEETTRAALGVGDLDLVIVTPYATAHRWKPNLSPHHIRLEMTTSLFADAPWTIVSPLSRVDIQQLLSEHTVTNIIGSDVFNRFLREGVPEDFATDPMIVTERASFPLTSAPVTLAGRPIIYVGATQLAFNHSASSIIRNDIATSGASPMMLDDGSAAIADSHGLYGPPQDTSIEISSPTPVQPDTTSFPDDYGSCVIVPRHGLMNGLLSESNIFEVRSPSGEVVAFKKTLPPYRSPLQNLTDELNGLESFNKLELSNARAPRAELTHEPPSLWVERAPGETITSILVGYERGERNLRETREILSTLGRTLRELHDRAPLPFCERAARLLSAHIEQTRALIETSTSPRLLEPGCRQAIERFTDASERLKKTGLRCGLIHGDANCGNFLWDESSKTLWAIDLQRFGTQLRTSAPAFPTQEYHLLLSSLQFFPNFGFRGIRGGGESLLEALREGYGPLPETEDTFFGAARTIERMLRGHFRAVPPTA